MKLFRYRAPVFPRKGDTLRIDTFGTPTRRVV